MPEKGKPVEYIAEEVLEVRYEPRGSFLAHAGEVADLVRDKGLFVHWELDRDRVDFRDSVVGGKDLTAFISFRNAGASAVNVPTRNFFRDQAMKFWKLVEQNDVFKIPKIQRIGVRNRCFIPLRSPFEAIEARVFDLLCKEDVIRVLGAKRRDVQVTLDLEDELGKLRTTIGPLERGEAKKLFRWETERFADAGVFVDIDTWWESRGDQSRSVDDFVRRATEKAWQRIDRLAEELGLGPWQ